jgi:acyl-coenzyme A synthetase/AMP-(fatty) acid ligase
MASVLAWRPNGPVTVRQFLLDAQSVAKVLPNGQALLNLCEDRYHFAVLFAACVISSKLSLQPSSHAASTLRQMAEAYPDVFCVADGIFDVAGLPRFEWPDVLGRDFGESIDIPQVDVARVVVVLFTSGSTGLPQPHAKTWGRLVRSASAEAVALGLNQKPHALIGTVPAQHSFGFESTVLLALHGGCSFWSIKPFFPQDVVDALLQVPRPRMLVTTPYHLSTLLAADIELPVIDMCLSATAPLSLDLALRAELAMGASLWEIYGSTESGQLACRHTSRGSVWQVLSGVVLEQEGDTTWAHGANIDGRVPLSDNIELQAGGAFLLHGRHSDLINIAGKRTSLAYLTHQLVNIEGVLDGAFFMPDQDEPIDAVVTRLVAFVVAPNLTSKQLMSELSGRMDRVFLPRPLCMVDVLPRNSTGKLSRQALQVLLRESPENG